MGQIKSIKTMGQIKSIKTEDETLCVEENPITPMCLAYIMKNSKGKNSKGKNSKGKNIVTYTGWNADGKCLFEFNGHPIMITYFPEGTTGYDISIINYFKIYTQCKYHNVQQKVNKT